MNNMYGRINKNVAIDVFWKTLGRTSDNLQEIPLKDSYSSHITIKKESLRFDFVSVRFDYDKQIIECKDNSGVWINIQKIDGYVVSSMIIDIYPKLDDKYVSDIINSNVYIKRVISDMDYCCKDAIGKENIDKINNMQKELENMLDNNLNKIIKYIQE